MMTMAMITSKINSFHKENADSACVLYTLACFLVVLCIACISSETQRQMVESGKVEMVKFTRMSIFIHFDFLLTELSAPGCSRM